MVERTKKEQRVRRAGREAARGISSVLVLAGTGLVRIGALNEIKWTWSPTRKAVPAGRNQQTQENKDGVLIIWLLVRRVVSLSMESRFDTFGIRTDSCMRKYILRTSDLLSRSQSKRVGQLQATYTAE